MKKSNFLSVVLAVFCFIILSQKIATAQEGENSHIKPYGNLYMFFGYKKAMTYDAAEKNKTDDDMLYKINNNSNLGFNFNYARYSGVFELGIDDYENNREVKIRKAFGAYRLGIGELKIGQDWNPYVKWSHEAANYYRSEGFGALYEVPTTQIKLTSTFGAYFAIIRPNVPTKTYYTEQSVINPATSSTGTSEYRLIEVEREITTGLPLDNIKAMAPKLALGYVYNSGLFNAGIGIAGNAYLIEKTEDVDYNKDWIISYMAYLAFDLKYKMVFINMNVGYAVNPANFGIAIQSNGNTKYAPGAAAALHNIATGKYEIKDTWNIQGYLEVGLTISNTIEVYIGYGYSLVDYPMVGTKVDYAMEYYLNVRFNLGNLIALTPAFSYRDYMKDMAGKKEGNDIYAGVLTTISYY